MLRKGKLFALPGRRLGAGLEDDGRTAKSETLADLVHQVALVRKMQRSAPVREHHEFRRPDRSLSDVENAAFFKVQLFHETVHFPSSYALRSGLVDLADELKQRTHARTGLGRQKHHGSV